MRLTLQGVGSGAPFRIRAANQEDARDIALLFLMSSDGLAAYIWSKSAEPGEDLTDVGARRYARTGTAFSYENCHIIEISGQIAGMLHAFELHADDTEETDPILQPYSQLEDPGSLYISGLAIHPEFRRKGLARRLMALSERLALAKGLSRVSLICFDQNEPALKLYNDLGFKETDRRPVVPHPSLHYPDGHALLLAHNLRSGEGG